MKSKKELREDRIANAILGSIVFFGLLIVPPFLCGDGFHNCNKVAGKNKTVDTISESDKIRKAKEDAYLNAYFLYKLSTKPEFKK